MRTNSLYFTSRGFGSKKMKGNHDYAEFDKGLKDRTTIINCIRGRSKAQIIFERLFQGMDVSVKKLLYYTEVRWLSRGTALSRVFILRKELKC